MEPVLDFRKKVDVSQYVPEFMREYAELKELYDIESISLQWCLQHAYDVYNSAWVYNAGEKALELYEYWWEIMPPGDATIEDRRVAILARMNAKMPFTKRILKRFLDNLCGKNGYEMNIDYGDRRLNLLLELKSTNQQNAIAQMLRQILPANMNGEVKIRYNQYETLSVFKYSDLNTYDFGNGAEKMTYDKLRKDQRIRPIYLRLKAK